MVGTEWTAHANGFTHRLASSLQTLDLQSITNRIYIILDIAGFNRTGFVVCSYLVQALGMSVDEALAAFEDARPPGVKHERFVKELHRRFDNHRWGSGHSTVGSETAASIGGFSQPRASFEGSVGSMQSDFKGVAEHLQRRTPIRQVLHAVLVHTVLQ